MNTQINYKNVGEELVLLIPEFKPMYEEHLKDNDELLPHILMGDFTRFFVRTFQKSEGNLESIEIISRCVKFIEMLIDSADPKVHELVGASFVENLQGEQNVNEMKSLFNEKVQKLFEMVFSK